MTECGICIGGGDYDPMDFCTVTYPKARKAHRCCECYRDIPKGVEYQRIAGKYDGQVDTYKTCLDCMNIRNGLQCDEGVGLGDLWEQVSYIFSEFNTTCLQKIKTVSAKEYMLERWNKWKFKEPPTKG